MDFYENRGKGENVLHDCKGHKVINNSVGLLINEDIHINSSPLLWKEGADFTKEAKKRHQVLRDINRKEYRTRHPATQQHHDSMEELSEDDEPPPKKTESYQRN